MSERYNWILNKQASPDFLSKFGEYPKVVGQLLFERNLDTPEKADYFFDPQYNGGLHDPFLLKNMKLACERIFKAMNKKEKIVIYSDYDVDGVSAATVLGEFFKRADYPFELYLPDRLKGGHGLNQSATELLVNTGANLIITLDCGTANIAELTWAKNKGVDVIVVDHHQVLHPVPAYALVNPHQEGDEYPFKYLCGTGLAFKLFLALVKSYPLKEWKDEQEKWLLDLVALATVADMMELLGENRIFVKYGLVVLAQTRRLGLKRLLESAGIKPEYNIELLTTNLDSMTLGWSLGPRLNAASRMAHASLAYELLNTADEDRVEELVSSLEEKNIKRQQLTEKIVKELEKIINSEDELPLFIVVGSPEWPVSLLGLVAGKVAQKYSRPVLLFEEKEDGICKASVRSIEGFNLISALGSVENNLVQYGGHLAAAGCSFKKENLNLVQQGLLTYAGQNITPDLLIKKLEISSAMLLAEADWSLVDWLNRFEPYGMGNPKPKFISKNVSLTSLVFMGQNGNHLKMVLKDETGKTMPAIFFKHNGLAEGLKIGDTLDTVYELEVNQWNGSKEIRLMLIDFTKHNG